ncbi:MAG: RtcB family protein [Kiritimatiellales bacterium]|nr:RtcB family protein [Kiritimatiellales bacterium]
MEWENPKLGKLPVKSWCGHVEKGALEQAANLANHPKVFRHVALMPDCHVGYGMPIGGVVACEGAVIPNAVGVDIGCGMCAVQTDFPMSGISRDKIFQCLEKVKARVPLGEGHCHNQPQQWDRFGELPGWLDARTRELAFKNLGSLGGGNHFIEMQEGDDGKLWLMIHSGSRNLGYRIAEHHHKQAMSLCGRRGIALPSTDLAYLEIESDGGQDYIREMNLALDYAQENRARMMAVFKGAISHTFRSVGFLKEINIHHNYAAPEEHFGEKVWVHRKGATSAKTGEEGIIPGSMGTASYIVKGLGNPESFESCSHGAGRVMGRMAASRALLKEECDQAMEGIVFGGWHSFRGGGKKMQGLLDLSEAPQAYKNIEDVISAESDLAEPVLKLRPLGVLKG